MGQQSIVIITSFIVVMAFFAIIVIMAMSIQFKNKEIKELERKDNENLFRQYGITQRERDVLNGLLEGKRNKEIADDLHVAIETVKSHTKSLYKKAEVNGRSEMIIKFRYTK